jgi:hypothetical protein
MVGTLLTIWNSTLRKPLVQLHISFSRKIKIPIYVQKLLQSSITRTDSIKDLGIFLDYKIHFHNRVNCKYIVSQCIKLWGPVCSFKFSISFLEYPYLLLFTLVSSKIGYASAVWYFVTPTDATKLEHTQQKFAVLCSFPHVPCRYVYALELLQFYSLRKRRYHLDAVFHFKVTGLCGSKTVFLNHIL